jgi:manganese/zinc/iron transport system substrate-binding protein
MPAMSARPAFAAIISLLATLALFIGACERAPARTSPPPVPNASAAPLQVVATTGMVADLVQCVAGNHAKVEALMGAGVDPHLYKPTRSDVAKLNAADAVFYSGLLLEGKMTETFDRLSASGKRVYAVTESIKPTDLRDWNADAPAEPGAAAASKHHDPHVWMDPVLWSEAISAIEQRLSAIDAPHAETFRTNAKQLKAELADLHAYAQKVLATVPEQSRVLVTAHDAFGYFGRRYSYSVEGVQGISTESEAGVKDIQRLVDLMVDRRIKAVFVESSVSSRNVEALRAGCKARGHDVIIGGELFSDAMGSTGTYEGTYIGMIDHNVTTIAQALGGTAPDRGMNGKLKK